jgi:hemerythrin-like metal-binding protein
LDCSKVDGVDLISIIRGGGISDFQKFEWDDSFQFGIEPIDSQHRRLLELINELMDYAQKGDQSLHQLTTMLHELVSYCYVHLDAEERMMEACRYPGYIDQLVEHGQFQKKIAELSGQVDQLVIADFIDLAQYLQGWWREHILGSDRLYVPYMKGERKGEIEDGPHLQQNQLQKITQMSHLSRAQSLDVISRNIALSDALLRQKQESELVLNSMDEGVVVVDRAGKITSINTRLGYLTGKSEVDFLGEPLAVLFADMEDAGEGGDVFKSQVLSMVNSRLQQIHDKNHEQFHKMLELAPVPLLVADLQEDKPASIFLVSSEMERILGYPVGALQEGLVDSLVTEESREQIRYRLQSASGNFHCIDVHEGLECKFRTKEGGEVVGTTCAVSILCGGDHHVVMMLKTDTMMDRSLLRMTPFGRLFVEDTDETAFGSLSSDRTLLSFSGEEIPVHLSGSLLQLKPCAPIQGAVIVVHDMRMLMSVESIKRASAAKDDFVAAMSHELRTPLTSIIGNSEFLAERLSDESNIKIIHAIEVAGRSQLSLVNDVLDMSKIESGKFAIDEVPYDLSALLGDIDHIFSIRARDAGLNFKVIQKEMPDRLLLGDGQRIGQILINLMSNAIKFTDSGEVTLTVWHSDKLIHFCVEDSGIGMSAEVQSRLFQRFEQADQTISRRFGGSGLGLYISNSLALLMKGSIVTESREGEGSTFQLNLPYIVTDQSNQQSKVERSGGESQPVERMEGTVLIAEDTPELQLLERRIVESMGPDVVTVSDGVKVLEVLAEQEFDLILMDMQMPRKNGIEATQEIRASGNSVPIVALAANVMQKHRDEFEAAGCDGFLAKPIDKMELRRMLEHTLNRVMRGGEAIDAIEEGRLNHLKILKKEQRVIVDNPRLRFPSIMSYSSCFFNVR